MTDQPTAPNPPVAQGRPKVLERHGDSRVDPYYWLRDKGNPEVTVHLEAENAYAEAVMAPTAELQETVYREIVGRVQLTDVSAPTFFKGYWHYTRTVEGLDYEVHCRRPASMDSPEQVLLDANQMAEGHAYFELGFVERSPDENLLAYAVDLTGNELHLVRFRHLASGEDLADRLRGGSYAARSSAGR